MGNQPSGDTGGSRPGGPRFLRTTGLLGLSKAELDKRCKPSGLYPSCNWEDKAIRRLIGDGKLSARLRGTENRTSPTDRECPICFLQYQEVNMTKCCSAYICTECYLQVRPQKAKSPSCPFCNHNKFSVTVAQTMNAEAMLAREETEQRFIEAKIRERAEAQAAVQVATSQQADGTRSQFGSSLQNDQRVATLRARSSSLSDTDNSEAIIPEDVLRESFAMTPEERRMLEDEMRAQHSHPLSLRLEAEAEERRLRNEQEFLRQNPLQAAQVATRGRSRRGRGSERRNWNQIVEAFERGGHGEVNSLDDLVVLEAAMILSMEEESRRRIAGNNATTGEDFDANRHANEGFPLVRSILSGSAEQNEQLQSLASSLSSRRRSRNSLMRAYGGVNDDMESAMDTAGLLMRGISEDDQIAMAIAASLQEQQHHQQQDSEHEEGEQNTAENNNNGTADTYHNYEEDHSASAADTAECIASATNNDEPSGEDPSVAAASNEAEEATEEAPIEATGEEAVQSGTTALKTDEARAEATETKVEEKAEPSTEGPLDFTHHEEEALN